VKEELVHITCEYFKVHTGLAIAQAVIRRLPTATARVRAQVRSCGICGGKRALGQVSSEYFGFPCQFSFQQLLHIHHHLSFGAGTIGQTVAAVPSGLRLTPTQDTKIKRGTYRTPLRRKKHIRHIILFQPDKTPLIGHSIETEDRMNFKKILCTAITMEYVNIRVYIS
jgi:hypothetical protein